MTLFPRSVLIISARRFDLCHRSRNHRHHFLPSKTAGNSLICRSDLITVHPQNGALLRMERPFHVICPQKRAFLRMRQGKGLFPDAEYYLLSKGCQRVFNGI